MDVSSEWDHVTMPQGWRVSRSGAQEDEFRPLQACVPLALLSEILQFPAKKGASSMKIILKPVHWNPNGYDRPAGAPAAPASYPGKYGFGHEEWNNAPWMIVRGTPQLMRAFHTEPAGAPESEQDALVFMYTSHGGAQYLVGAAARAQNITDMPKLRESIARRIKADDVWRDAWALSGVKSKFKHDLAAFRRWWAKDSFQPRWVAPITHWWWAELPVRIDPLSITRKSKFNTRFTSHTVLETSQALTLLRMVPVSQRTPAWYAIAEDVSAGDRALTEDIEKIENERSSPTTKKQLIDARLGQGAFRDAVLDRWNGKCAVTGCAMKEVLRASHIKAWRECTTRAERLDPANGLPLVASLDALFDRHLISFEPSDGSIVIATGLDQRDRRSLGVTGAGLARTPDAQQRRYLRIHREAFRQRHNK